MLGEAELTLWYCKQDAYWKDEGTGRNGKCDYSWELIVRVKLELIAIKNMLNQYVKFIQSMLKFHSFPFSFSSPVE